MMSAADWPQWLGPDRDGKSTETGVVSRWTQQAKTGALQPLWNVSLGAGYAGVVVSDGVAYTAATQAGQDQLIAWDALTGSERWAAPLGTRYVDSMGYHGPRATPTITEDRIVALNGAGTLAVFSSASGDMLWSTHLVDDHGGKMPQWGYAASPFVDEGIIYVDTGAGEGKSLLALTLAEGRPIWRSGTDQAGYATPVRAKLAGVDQILVFGGSVIQGMRPEDGTVLWSKAWRTSYGVNAATPIPVGKDRLFISSGYGKGGALIRVDPSGPTEAIWQTKRMKNKLSTSILDNDRLYGFSESTLTAIRLSDGEPIWTHSGLGLGTLMMVDKHLVVLSDQCELALIDPRGSSPQIVVAPQRIVQSNDCWTVPTLSDGILFVRSPTQLVALDLR
jgi:hypothetical protein